MVFGGDDDDKERFWKNQAKALALAPFNGIPVIRTMMEGYANAVSGNSFYDDQYPGNNASAGNASSFLNRVLQLLKYCPGSGLRCGLDE